MPLMHAAGLAPPPVACGLAMRLLLTSMALSPCRVIVEVDSSTIGLVPKALSVLLAGSVMPAPAMTQKSFLRSLFWSHIGDEPVSIMRSVNITGVVGTLAGDVKQTVTNEPKQVWAS